jgi:hypothetical protein
VVLPAADYRDARVEPADRPASDALLTAASAVVTMPFATSCRAAYRAANDHVLGRAGRLVAIWDGSAPDGRGGTSEAVHRARAAGMEVVVVWPTAPRAADQRKQAVQRGLRH